MTAFLAVSRRGDVPVVGIVGEVDMTNARTLGSELRALVPNTALGLVLDLSETTYVDSQGVHLVLRLAEALREHGQRLCIAVPGGSHVRRVLQIAYVDDHVPLEASVADAVAAIAGA